MMLAETSQGFEWVAPLLQTGAVGGVLVWFMFRSEPRMRSIEMALDRISRSVIVLAIAISLALKNDGIKAQAEIIEKDLDEADKTRGRA